MFTIDGVEWSVPCSIERVAEVKSSDISGMMMNKQYFNDVYGTWMKYTIAIAVPKGYEDQYTDLYEMLTMPKDGHVFVLPYNQSDITITGRLEVVSDRWVMSDTGHKWKRTKFNIIANHPSKTMDLNSVITTGMTPLPPDPEATVGDLYEFTSGGWVQRFYADAEDEYF